MAIKGPNQSPRPPKSTKNPASAPVPNSDHGKQELEPAANLAEAKLRVMCAVPYIRKRGSQSSYSFVRDVDVIAMLRPAMVENKIILCGPVAIQNRISGVLTTGGGKAMQHTSCEFKFQLKHAPSNETEDIWVIGEGADNLDKSSNKCMSAARKYALLLGFSITTGDDPDQFDAEGNFAGGAEDSPQSPPPVPAKGEAKTEAKAEAASPIPATGEELHRRLSDYDAKLAGLKLCSVGALLSSIVAGGVQLGYNADIKSWTGPQIQFAVDATKEFDAKVRQKPAATAPVSPPVAPPVVSPPPAPPVSPPVVPPVSPPPPVAPPVAPPVSPPPPASPPPAPAAATGSTTGPSATERFDKRIAGMNITQKLANLDSFRAKYTEDKEMTDAQVGALEACYWANKKRIGG